MEPERISELESAAFANFANAISAAGTVMLATVVVSTVMSVTTAITVPANVKLRFTGGGMLAVGSGGVVTINGSIMAAPTQQLFALTGTGAVYTSTATVPEVWVEWFGAKADASGASGVGTDSTAAIQAAINAPMSQNTVGLPNGGGLVRFSGGAYRVTAPLQVYNLDTANYRNNIRLLGMALDSETVNGTLLFWDSATATTAVIQLWTRDSTVQGIGIAPASGRTALVGIDIDDAYTATSHGTGQHIICTNNRVIDCLLLQTFSGGTMTYGARVGQTAAGNAEFMTFRHAQFYQIPLSGAGVFFPNSNFQSKRNQFDTCQFSGVWTAAGTCYGISSNTADYVLRKCNFNQLSTACYHTNACDAIELYDCSEESCRQLIQTPGGTNIMPILISGGRFAGDKVVTSAPATANDYFIYKGFRGPLTLIGVTFDQNYRQFWQLYVHDGSGADSLVIAIGTTFPNPSPLAASASYRAIMLGNAYTDAGGNPQPMDDQMVAAGSANQFTVSTPLNIQAPGRQPLYVSAVVSGGPALAPLGSLLPTGGTLANDYFRWAVSFTTSAGESKIGAPTATLSTNNTTSQGVLTEIPVGPAGVSTVNVYRWDNTSNTYGKVGSVTNGVTTFTDNGIPKGAAPPGSDTSGLTTLQDGMIETDGQTATTVGAAGAATALPANPVGYRVITVGGTRYKVPYYNI